MCKKCDNIEGNMCQMCEAEQNEVRQMSMTETMQQIIETSKDVWAGFGERSEKRSINSGASGHVPEGFMYV